MTTLAESCHALVATARASVGDFDREVTRNRLLRCAAMYTALTIIFGTPVLAQELVSGALERTTSVHLDVSVIGAPVLDIGGFEQWAGGRLAEARIRIAQSAVGAPVLHIGVQTTDDCIFDIGTQLTEDAKLTRPIRGVEDRTVAAVTWVGRHAIGQASRSDCGRDISKLMREFVDAFVDAVRAARVASRKEDVSPPHDATF